MKDDSQVFGNDTSLHRKESPLPSPIEAPAELEVSKSDKFGPINTEMMSSVNISQTFPLQSPLLLSQVPNFENTIVEDSQIQENKNQRTAKHSLVENFRTKSNEKNKSVTEVANGGTHREDRISEVEDSEDKSKQMISDSQLTVKKINSSFKRVKPKIIENNDYQTEVSGEEMKLANLKLKPGEAEEDLKKLALNGNIFKVQSLIIYNLVYICFFLDELIIDFNSHHTETSNGS